MRASTIATNINSRGFPAMTVPAGFTTRVYDRDASNQLKPPVAAALPVGIDFLGLPFSEPTLFEIAGAYEAVSRHRTPPPDFGPVNAAQTRALSTLPATPRPMPEPRTLSEDELRATQED
jgi:hypothetical protein